MAVATLWLGNDRDGPEDTAGAKESLAALRGVAVAGTPAQCDQVHGNDQGIRPDVFTYNAVISACRKGRTA